MLCPPGKPHLGPTKRKTSTNQLRSCPNTADKHIPTPQTKNLRTKCAISLLSIASYAKTTSLNSRIPSGKTEGKSWPCSLDIHLSDADKGMGDRNGGKLICKSSRGYQWKWKVGRTRRGAPKALGFFLRRSWRAASEADFRVSWEREGGVPSQYLEMFFIDSLWCKFLFIAYKFYVHIDRERYVKTTE